MPVTRFLMPVAALTAALALGAATLPPVLTDPNGLWEVSRSATGAQPERSCVPRAAELALWEHRRSQCKRTVISSTPTEAVIHYTCQGKDFGHASVKVITPRTLRIQTQGISQGYPFNYVLHARRIGNCPAH
jgi:hypothetical protein